MEYVKFAYFRTRKLHYSCWPPGPKLLSHMGGMDTPCPWPQGLPQDHGTSIFLPSLDSHVQPENLTVCLHKLNNKFWKKPVHCV